MPEDEKVNEAPKTLNQKKKISNKYLIFSLGDENYGIPITKVREVIRFVKITNLHESSLFLKGVINLRGRIIPIIDMRLKLGMEEKDYTDRTVFIIVEVLGKQGPFLLGISVDAVNDVVDIEYKTLEKTPDLGLNLKSQYLYGIAQIDENMIMVINIDRILTTEEIINLNNLNVNDKIKNEEIKEVR